MKPVFWKEFKTWKLSLIVYTLAAVGLVLLYVALYPSLQSQADTYNKLLSSMPKGFAQAFGIDTDFLGKLEGYIASEMFSFVWPIILIFFAASRAGSSIAGEIEKGTIGTLLSQPISRTRLYWAKVSSSVVGLFIFVVVSILSAIPIAILFKLHPATNHYLSLTLLGLLFGLAIYSFTLLLSAVASDKTKVYATVGGILMLMYVANIVASLKQSLNWLKYGSAFHYYDAPAALIRNHLSVPGMFIFVVISSLCLLTGQLLFNRRDISI